MAKIKELTPLKKGKCEFNLIGRVKISDFTFKLDCESSISDWIYNQMNLGVDCGKYGIIYADLMGGYGANRDNVVYVHGTKKNEKDKTVDDYKKQIKVSWEDRFDEEILETIGQSCFITVGIEKDINDKTVYKKFISEYDAIQYINENLKSDVVVNIKGSLTYQQYQDNISVKKTITSMALSKAEEDKFKATFTQTLLLDCDAIGKPDKETRTIPIDAMVIDYAKKFNDIDLIHKVDGKVIKGLNVPLMKTFDIEIEDKEKTQKMLKFFKAKNKKVTELTVDGIFTKGALETVEVSDKDIPEDIRELIELGYIDKNEVMEKIAFSNGGKKKERMVITKPHIDMIAVKQDDKDVKLPQLAREVDKYTEDDICIESIFEYYEINSEESVEVEDIKDNKEISESEVLDKALEGIEEDDDNWLDDLD